MSLRYKIATWISGGSIKPPDDNFLYKALKKHVPEIIELFKGPLGIFYYTDVKTQCLAYSLSVAFLRRGGKDDVRAEPYPSNKEFTETDIKRHYVFILDRPPRDGSNDVRSREIHEYAKDVGKMIDPAGVWLVALPENDSQQVRILDLLEESERLLLMRDT